MVHLVQNLAFAVDFGKVVFVEKINSSMVDCSARFAVDQRPLLAAAEGPERFLRYHQMLDRRESFAKELRIDYQKAG